PDDRNGGGRRQRLGRGGGYRSRRRPRAHGEDLPAAVYDEGLGHRAGAGGGQGARRRQRRRGDGREYPGARQPLRGAVPRGPGDQLTWWPFDRSWSWTTIRGWRRRWPTFCPPSGTR